LNREAALNGMSNAPSATSHSSLRALRVLVVEDESIVSFLLEDMLAELGCRVVGHAVSVGEALALLDKHKPDAAVLDVNLRGEMAFPIAEWLESNRTAFVFATGYGLAGIPERWRRFPVLQKPFRLSALAKALETALAGNA
jgi:CheY-like chemotaxis protein